MNFVKQKVVFVFISIFLFNSLAIIKSQPDPPVLIMAQTSVNGQTIELSFDKTMADPNGQESSFSLDIASMITSVSLKAGDPQVVVLELDNRIHYGESATLSYIQGTIQSDDGALLLDFSESVTNNLVEPPTLVSAQTNTSGSQIELSFNKAMSDPVNKEQQFTVNATSTITIMQISLKAGDEKIIVLNLETNIAYGETVNVSYIEGDVSSTDEGLLDAFDNEFVQNNVAEPPQFVSAETDATGSIIELSFNKNMSDPTGNLAQFTVSNGINQTIENIVIKSGDLNIIVLTLQQSLGKQDAITVSYEKGTVQSTDGGQLESFIDKTVTNNILEAPVLLAANSSEDGLSVVLSFDKPMKDPSGEQTSFSISHNGGNTINKIELKQGYDSLFVLSLQNAIPFGAEISLSYTKGNIQSSGGAYLESFADSTVINNVKETTFVSSNYIKQDVTIFPNPSNGEFNIKANNLFNAGCQLEIIKLNGEIIQSIQIEKQTGTLNFIIDEKHKSAGLFLIRLHNKEQTVTKKIYVKH